MTMTKPISAAVLLTQLHTGNSIDPKKCKTMLTHVRNGDKLNEMRTHALAVAAIHRSMPIGQGGSFDCSLADTLVNSLGKRVRAKALVAWFAAYSNIRLLRDDKTGLYTAKLIPPASKMFVEAKPADALAKPFWEVEEKGTDPASFTTETLDRRLSLLLKAAGDAKLPASVKAIVDEMQALANKLHKMVPADGHSPLLTPRPALGAKAAAKAVDPLTV